MTIISINSDTDHITNKSAMAILHLPGAGAAFPSPLPAEAAGTAPPKLKPEDAGVADLDEEASPKAKPPAAGAGVLAAPPPKVKPPAAGAGVLAPVPPNEKPLLAAGAGDGAPKLNAMVVIFAMS